MVFTSSHTRNRRAAERWHFDVAGVVQGVGFRPFLHGLADTFHLGGWARNTSRGVELELGGAIAELEQFREALINEAPLAHIIHVSVDRVGDVTRPLRGFSIKSSSADRGRTLVSPDVSTCEACRDEIFDPKERCYRYPFTNCTHCGPRFTILDTLPYDRARTSRAGFEMCPSCANEYTETADRRYHAQPIACPECGPSLNLLDREGRSFGLEPDDVIQDAAERLLNGEILAIKGLGGYHIACLARDEVALARLRSSKFRPSKPCALMAPSLISARQVGMVGPEEAQALLSRESTDRYPAQAAERAS